MNRPTLTGLLITLAGLSGLLGITLHRTRPDPPPQPLFLPELKAQGSNLQRLLIISPKPKQGEGQSITLERGAEGWTLAERHHYPADLPRIRQFLQTLDRARRVEEKTSDPKYYPRLGLEDPLLPGATGVQITLEGRGTPVSLVLGRRPQGTENLTYARRMGEATGWLITGEFGESHTPPKWLNRSLTRIPATRLTGVTVSTPGYPLLRLSKVLPSDQSFRLALPPGRTAGNPAEAERLVAVLTDLRLTEVQTREVLGTNPGKPVVSRFFTGDGLVLEISAWRLPEGLRVTFSASGQGPGRGEAVALNNRLGGWVYTLSSQDSSQLTRRLSDLLAPDSHPRTSPL